MTENGRNGFTLWFTGLSGAGKTTIAELVRPELERRGLLVEWLDGDEVREHLSRDLGFSRADRDTQVLRVGWVAKTLASHGVTVLVSLVSPYADARDKVRALHEESGVAFFEVHVATPLDVTRERDVKGLYARQARGELTGLTGVDDPYEPPAAPDLVVHTQDETVAASAARVLELLEGTR